MIFKKENFSVLFFSFKNDWFVLLMLLSFGNILAQKKSINLFDKIVLESPSMKYVNNYHMSGNNENALGELLKIYRSKESLYNRVSKNDILYIKEHYAEDVFRSIEIADQVVNQFFVFRDEWDMERTNIPYQFKSKINWLANPFGDPEWTYMLNRHKYWIHLARAYFFTGKEKYAKTFVHQVVNWIDNNPLEKTNNGYVKLESWRTIEAGIRCENWIKSFELIKESKHVTPAFLEKFLNSLYQHGEYISSNYSDFSKTSNWGILENQGLYNLSLFLSEFKLAPIWLNIAIDRLEKCAKLQILDDGTHWEHSPMYHNEVFHCYMNINLLAKRNHIELPEVILKKTKDMAYANVGWQKPNYHQPLLGDSDDTDLRGLLTFSAYLFNDPVLKSRGFKKLDYDSFLILGSKENKRYIQMSLHDPNFLSVYQQNSGDFYMRSSWDEEATYSSFHLKKLATGHSHDDFLSFTIFANKVDYLVDNGRYTYVDNGWRNLFKGSFAHNSLAVDDLPNSILSGSWDSKYLGWTDGIYTKSTELFDYGEAEFSGYKRLSDPVTTKRRLFFLKPNIWLVFDSFSANGNHKYSQYFNFPNKEVQIKDKEVITTYSSKNLLIKPLKDIEFKLENSWYSSEYNLKKESRRVELFKKSKGFNSFISLIYFPELTKLKYSKTDVYNVRNELLSNEDAEAVTLTVDDIEYTLVVIYNSPNINSHFFKVNDIIVHGEIILIEKKGKVQKVHIIKD